MNEAEKLADAIRKTKKVKELISQEDAVSQWLENHKEKLITTAIAAANIKHLAPDVREYFKEAITGRIDWILACFILQTGTVSIRKFISDDDVLQLQAPYKKAITAIAEKVKSENELDQKTTNRLLQMVETLETLEIHS